MSLPLSNELRDALRQHPGEPLRLRDEESQRDYLLIDAATAPRVVCDWLRLAIDEGVRDLEEGRVSPWDTEEIKRLGRELLAEQMEK